MRNALKVLFAHDGAIRSASNSGQMAFPIWPYVLQGRTALLYLKWLENFLAPSCQPIKRLESTYRFDFATDIDFCSSHNTDCMMYVCLLEYTTISKYFEGDMWLSAHGIFGLYTDRGRYCLRGMTCNVSISVGELR